MPIFSAWRAQGKFDSILKVGGGLASRLEGSPKLVAPYLLGGASSRSSAELRFTPSANAFA